MNSNPRFITSDAVSSSWWEFNLSISARIFLSFLKSSFIWSTNPSRCYTYYWCDFSMASISRTCERINSSFCYESNLSLSRISWSLILISWFTSIEGTCICNILLSFSICWSLFKHSYLTMFNSLACSPLISLISSIFSSLYFIICDRWDIYFSFSLA